MRRLVLVLMGAALIAGTGALTVPAAALVTCTTGNTLYGSSSSVVVPNGNTCNIQGLPVNGSVTVQPGGRLVIGGGATINGSVNSTNAGTDSTLSQLSFSFSVCISNTHVKGSVSIAGSESQVVVGGGNVTGGNGCGGNKIDGGVTLNGNKGGVQVAGNGPPGDPTFGDCAIATCGISGAVNVNNNSGFNTYHTSFTASIRQNAIGGSLNCTGNVNGVHGYSNTMVNKSAKTGQCTAV